MKTYYIPIQVPNNFDKEHVQKMLQDKATNKSILEIEDIIDIRDPNETFGHEYIFGSKEKAMEVFDNIDPNYDEGYFFIITAKRGDKDMLGALIKKGENDPNTIKSMQEALKAAARSGHENCVELLIENGADPIKLLGTTSYDNHECIKNLIDKKIEISNSKKE